MRIVAGRLRSRKIQAVSGDSTRPTGDKIKGAIYSRLGPYFTGGIMLDLFGGSGNMGLEALSRGFDEVYFCDRNPKAIATIQANAQDLKVAAQCHIMKKDYRQMLREMNDQKICFDLIYLDPPYRDQRIDEILQYIAAHRLLKPQGDIVCESRKEDVFLDQYEDIVKRKEVTYGITKITYYTRSEL